MKGRLDGGGSFNQRKFFMENQKHTVLKPTATSTPKATQDIVKSEVPSKKLDTPSGTTVQANADNSKTVEIGAVKNDSNAIKSTPEADSALIKHVSTISLSDKDMAVKNKLVSEKSKMDIATEIYKRMVKTKGITRKEILQQFMTEASLSKAGSSTYFQLIKAKLK